MRTVSCLLLKFITFCGISTGYIHVKPSYGVLDWEHVFQAVEFSQSSFGLESCHYSSLTVAPGNPCNEVVRALALLAFIVELHCSTVATRSSYFRLLRLEVSLVSLRAHV